MLGLLRFCMTSCLSGRPHNYGPVGHLQIQKLVWPEIIKNHGIAVDATCGNGHDSRFLAELLQLDRDSAEIDNQTRQLFCIDIQKEAIDSTFKALNPIVHKSQWNKVQLVHASHENFPESISPESVSLICYNLGYLPGTPRKNAPGSFVQTSKDSTEKSLLSAIPLLKENGLLSVTAYPGNIGGEDEQNKVEEIFSALSPSDWRVYKHSPINRPLSPHLYLAFRIGKSP